MEKGRILIVDDASDIRKVLGDILRQLGYSTSSCDHGGHALRLLQAESFDLAIVDLFLPGLDGLELVREARSLDPGLEVIILTGFGNLDSAVAALRLGAYDYFRKPIEDLTQFTNSVERALERRRLRQANHDLIVQLRAAKQRIEKQRVNELERIEQIGRALTSNLQREQIVELLQQALLGNDDYGAEAIALLTWNSGGQYDTLSVRSRRHLDPAVLIPLSEQMFSLAGSAGGPASKSAPIEMNLLAGEKYGEQRPVAEPLREGDYQILPVQGRPMGILAMFAPGPERMSEECHRVFHILAQQAATALDSLALFDQVRELARRDGLTQLFNHVHFMDLLDGEVRRSRRYRRAVSLLFMDIDDFKRVNDSLGHQMGDQVLVQLARVLQANVRDTDLAGRYGGEEFVVLLPESTRREAVALAERLRALIEAHVFEANSIRVQITVSFGVAAFEPDRVGTSDELLHLADHALLRAKSSGRNRVITQESSTAGGEPA